MKRAVPLAVLVAAGVLAAGCSGDAEPKAGTSPSRQAASPPPAPAPATVGAVTLPDDPAGLVTTVGRQIKAARSFHVQLVSTGTDGSAVRADGDVRTDTATPSALLKVSDGGTTHAVLLDGVIYVRNEGEEVEPGRPWARLARKDIGAVRPSGDPGPQISKQADDLEKTLRTLLDGVDEAFREITADTGLALVRSGSLTKKPVKDRVNGQDARRYDGTTASGAVGGDPALKALDSGGIDKLPWSLWVDDKGLPQKFTVSMAGKARLEATYTRWGTPVTIQAPPANQVAGIR
ncbi:hypothetical protein [Actinomadura chokoriensis]|uniref:LppX_LprAFG lipoprotein n=1 Tax=Actinomadura chokoriensis TaxID=454156 RepID=A0ABV4QQF8_9ACTN